MQQHEEADITHMGLRDPENGSELEHHDVSRAMDAGTLYPSPLSPCQTLHHGSRPTSTTDDKMTSNTTDFAESADPITATRAQWFEWLVSAVIEPENHQSIDLQQLTPPCLMTLRKKLRVSHYGVGILPTELRDEVCVVRYCARKLQLIRSSSDPFGSPITFLARIQFYRPLSGP